MGHEVVMIGKDGPGLNLPAAFAQTEQQLISQEIQLIVSSEQMLLSIGRGGHNECSRGAQAMFGSMRPPDPCRKGIDRVTL